VKDYHVGRLTLLSILTLAVLPGSHAAILE